MLSLFVKHYGVSRQGGLSYKLWGCGVLLYEIPRSPDKIGSKWDKWCHFWGQRNDRRMHRHTPPTNASKLSLPTPKPWTPEQDLAIRATIYRLKREREEIDRLEEEKTHRQKI